jgi:hypothetical protein
VIVLLCARFGLYLLSSSGTCPFRPEVALPAPLRRRRCGSTGADPSSAARPRSRDPRADLWLHLASARSPAAAGDPHHSRLGTPGDLPASPSAPLLRCPGAGAVTPRAVPLVARSQPRPWSLACGRGSFASHRTRLRCLGPKTVGGPPAARSRRRGLGGSPSTRTKARNGGEPCRRGARRNRGVRLRRRRAQAKTSGPVRAGNRPARRR